MRTAMATILVLGLGLFVAVLGLSQAAEYPQKPITVVVPHPPGGGTDMVARALAEKMRAHLGQPVVVVNKSSTPVGISEVILARPDGYTLGYVHSNYLTLSPLLSELPFKGPRDMSIIATAHTTGVVLAVAPDSPWKTTRDLLEASKAAPGKIRVSGSNLGSINHLDFLELNELGKGQLVYVPFVVGPQALAAFLGGHAEAFTNTPIEAKPHIDAGKVRVLGVFAQKRSALIPDVPTMKEQGFDVSYVFTGVLFGPKALPDQVKSTLQEAAKKVIQESAYIDSQLSKGFETFYVSSDDLTKQLAAEQDKMKVLVERFNLKGK